MISAIDRLYGNRGGEGAALITLLSLSLWIAYQHWPLAHAWLDQTCAVADLAIRSLESRVCSVS